MARLRLVALTLSLGWFLSVFGAPARAESLRELADFAGVRDNVLVGYGLVVGLDGSGDQTMQTPFTTQSLTNMFSQLGIAIPPGTNMQLRNVAGVMVTADLPPFSAPGQRIDVVVSSIGNARSLRGGTLLMTPLKGADGATYVLSVPDARGEELIRDVVHPSYFQEPNHIPHLYIVIMSIRIRTELDLFDFDDLLLLPGLGFTLLLFVFELAEIHDLTNWRIGVWRNLDEIEASLFCQLHAFCWMHNADVVAVSTDKADFRGADILVYARAGISLWRRVVRSAGYRFLPSVVNMRLAQFMPRQKAIQAVNTGLKGKERLKLRLSSVIFVQAGNIRRSENRTIRQITQRCCHDNIGKFIRCGSDKGKNAIGDFTQSISKTFVIFRSCRDDHSGTVGHLLGEF